MDKHLILTFGTTSKTISFPNVGQILKIESYKNTLADNDYLALLKNSYLASGAFALDLVDSLATFMVLFPEILKDYKIKTYEDLDAFEAIKITKLYKEVYFPWYIKIQNELFAPDKEKTVGNDK